MERVEQIPKIIRKHYEPTTLQSAKDPSSAIVAENSSPLVAAKIHSKKKNDTVFELLGCVIVTVNGPVHLTQGRL